MAYTGGGGGGGAAGGAGRNADMYSRTDSESAPRPIDLRVFATFVNKILPIPLIDKDLFFPKKTLPSVDFLGDLRRSNDPGHGGVEINGTFYPMGTGTSYMTGESTDATSLEGDFTHFLTTTGLTAVLSPIMPVIYGHYDQTVYGNCLYFFLKSFTLEKDKTQSKFLSPSDEGSIDRTILSQEGGIFYLKFHSQISKISLLGTHGRDNLELNLTVMVKLQVIPLEAADVAAATVDAATSDNTGGGGAGRDRRSNAQAMEAMATAHDDLIKEESGKLKLHEVTLSGPDTGAFNALIEEIISHEALCNALKQRQAFINSLPNLAGARPLNDDQKRKLLLATPLNLFADYTQTSNFTSLLTALQEVYGEDTVNTTPFIGTLMTSIREYATNATICKQMLIYFTTFRTSLQRSAETAKARLLTPGEEAPDLQLFGTPAVPEAEAPAMVAGAETVDPLQVFIDAFPPHSDGHPLTPEEKTALQATIPLHLFDPDSTIPVDLTAMELHTVLPRIYEDTPDEKQSEMLLAWIRCIKKHARNSHVDYTPFKASYIDMADDKAMATEAVDKIISGGIEDGEAAAPVPQPATVYGGATESKGPDYALEVALDAGDGRDRSLATAADAVAAALDAGDGRARRSDAGDLEAMAAAVDDLDAGAVPVTLAEVVAATYPRGTPKPLAAPGTPPATGRSQSKSDATTVTTPTRPSWTSSMASMASTAAAAVASTFSTSKTDAMAENMRLQEAFKRPKQRLANCLFRFSDAPELTEDAKATLICAIPAQLFIDDKTISDEDLKTLLDSFMSTLETMYGKEYVNTPNFIIRLHKSINTVIPEGSIPGRVMRFFADKYAEVAPGPLRTGGADCSAMVTRPEPSAAGAAMYRTAMSFTNFDPDDGADPRRGPHV